MQIKIPVRLPESPVERQLLKSMVDTFDHMAGSLVEDIETILLGDMSVQSILLFKGTSSERILIKSDSPSDPNFHHKQYTRVRNGKVETIQAHGSAPIEELHPDDVHEVDSEAEHNTAPPKPEATNPPKIEKKPLDPPTYYWSNYGGYRHMEFGYLKPDDEPATPEEIAQRIAIFKPSVFALDDQEGRDVMYKWLENNPQISGLSTQDTQLLSTWQRLEAKFRSANDIKVKEKVFDGRQDQYPGKVRNFLIQTLSGGDRELEAQVGSTIDRVQTGYKNALAHPEAQGFFKAYAERLKAAQMQRELSWEGSVGDFETLGDSLHADIQGRKESLHILSSIAAMGLFSKSGSKIVPHVDLMPTGKAYYKDESYFNTGTGKKAVSRMSNSQLAATLVGVYLARCYDTGSSSYYNYPMYNYPAQLHVMDQEFRHRLGDEAAEKVMEKYKGIAEKLGNQLNDANDMKDQATRHICFSGSKLFKGGLEALDPIEKHFQEVEKARSIGVEKQRDNTAVEIPESMKDGKWGGRVLNSKTGKPWSPFTHQTNAVNWMQAVKKGILALGVGLGKTSTVVLFSEKKKEEWAKQGRKHTSIVVLPPTLMYQWPSEIQSFVPGAKVLMLPTDISKDARKALLRSKVAKDADYILISQSSFGKEKGATVQGGKSADDDVEGLDEGLISALNDIDGSVFVDECHQGGFKKGARTVTKKGKKGEADSTTHHIGGVVHETMKRINANREHTFGMSATPMPNDPVDLHALGELFAPGSFGDREEWEDKLEGVSYDANSGYQIKDWKSVAKLKERIAPFIMSRNVDDPIVKADMGANNAELDTSDSEDVDASNTPCPKTGRSQVGWLAAGGYIDQLVEHKLERINEERRRDGKLEYDDRMAARYKAGQGLMLRRLAAITPALIDPNYEGPAPKIDRLVDMIKQHFGNDPNRKHHEDGTPISVFSSFPGQAYDHLKKKLLEAGIHPERIGFIDQSVSPEDRSKMQDLYNQGHIKILLLGQKSGGAGLNLQHSSHKQYNLDEPWTPEGKEQSIGRQKRVGQKSTHVQSITVRTRGSYDGHMEVGLNHKQVMVSALLGNLDVNAIAASGNPEQFLEEHQRAMVNMTGRVRGDSDLHQETAWLESQQPDLGNSHGIQDLAWKNFDPENLDTGGMLGELDSVLKGDKAKKVRELNAQRAKEKEIRFTPKITPETKAQAEKDMPGAASPMSGRDSIMTKEGLSRKALEEDWDVENAMKQARNMFAMHVNMGLAHDEAKYPDEAIKSRSSAAKILNHFQNRYRAASNVVENLRAVVKEGESVHGESHESNQADLKTMEAKLKQYQGLFPEAFQSLDVLKQSLITTNTEGASRKSKAKAEKVKGYGPEATQTDPDTEQALSKQDLGEQDIKHLDKHLTDKQKKQVERHREHLTKLKTDPKAHQEYKDRVKESLGSVSTSTQGKAFAKLLQHHSDASTPISAAPPGDQKRESKPAPVANSLEQFKHVRTQHAKGTPLHPEDAYKVINHMYSSGQPALNATSLLQGLDPSYDSSHVLGVYQNKIKNANDLYKKKFGHERKDLNEGVLKPKEHAKHMSKVPASMHKQVQEFHDIVQGVGADKLDELHDKLTANLARNKKMKPKEKKALQALTDHSVATRRKELLEARDGIPLGEGVNLTANKPTKPSKPPELAKPNTPPPPTPKPAQEAFTNPAPATKPVKEKYAPFEKEDWGPDSFDPSEEGQQGHLDAQAGNLEDLKSGKMRPEDLGYTGYTKEEAVSHLKEYLKAGNKALQGKKTPEVQTNKPKPVPARKPAEQPPATTFAKEAVKKYIPHKMGISFAENHADLIPDTSEKFGNSIYSGSAARKFVSLMSSEKGKDRFDNFGEMAHHFMGRPGAYKDPEGNNPYSARKGKAYMMDLAEELHKVGAIKEMPPEDPALTSWGKLKPGKPIPNNDERRPSGMTNAQLSKMIARIGEFQGKFGSFEDFAHAVLSRPGAWKEGKDEKGQGDGDKYTRRKGVAYFRDVLEDLANAGYLKGYKP